MLYIMNRKAKFYQLTCLLVLTGLTYTGYCQKLQWDKGQTFIEANDPTTVNGALWLSVKAGLHCSFVSIDKRYAKSEVPNIKIENNAHVRGWKGERLSAQLLLWTTDSIPAVH